MAPVKHYPLAVREEVLREIDEGLSVATASRRFGISASTIGHWRRRQQTTGSVVAIRHPGRQPRIGPTQVAVLQAQLAAHPGATLAEHCARWRIEQGVQVSVGTMWRVVHALDRPANSQRELPVRGTAGRQEQKQRQPGETMEQTADETAAFQAFTTELVETEWQASLTNDLQAESVCLQLERPSPTSVAGVQRLVLCRRTLALAVRSAQKHIGKRPSG